MIPSSWIAKSLAGTSAFAILTVMLLAATTDTPVEIEGGSPGPPVQAQLGSSFVDLARGTQAADPAEPLETADSNAAEPTRPDAPTALQTPVTEPIRPDAPSPPESPAAKPSTISAVEPNRPDAPADLPTVSTDAPTVAGTPDTVAAAPPPIVAAETVVGGEPEPGMVLTSPRPTARPRAFEQVNRRPDPPKPAASAPQSSTPRSSSPKGSATATARAGSNTGGRSASKTQSGARSQASQVGSAAASNYPGEVMARLNRVRRPSIRATGQARVAFAVSSSGGLSSVGIAASSGSSELDRAAVRIVQRAAPFPPPPPGAQRNFAINISGR